MSNSKVKTSVIYIIEGQDGWLGEALQVSVENNYTTIQTTNSLSEKFFGNLHVCLTNDFAKALGEALIKASSGE